MKLCCNMLILKETLGKKMEIWGTQKKHKHCFWSLCVYCLFFFLSICLYFCCFPDTIKRNKSRLNRRLNPGLKSALFLIFFSMFSRFPKLFLQNQHFAAKFPFFWFCFCFFLSLLLSLCFPGVFILIIFLFFMLSRFLNCFFLKFFFPLILEFCEEFFFTTIYRLYIDYFPYNI